LETFSCSRPFTQCGFEGHQWYWQTQDAGAVEKHLLENYGTVARWNGPLGVRSAVITDKWVLTVVLPQEERLWVADPKAINHILKNSGVIYKKLSSTRELIVMILDRGLAWADGNTFSNRHPLGF